MGLAEAYYAKLNREYLRREFDEVREGWRCRVCGAVVAGNTAALEHKCLQYAEPIPKAKVEIRRRAK